MNTVGHQIALPSRRRLLPTVTDTNRNHPFVSAEGYTSGDDGGQCDKGTMNYPNENDTLALDVNYALAKRRNRRYSMSANRLFFARSNETRAVDQFTSHDIMKSENCFDPIASDHYEYSTLKFNRREVEEKLFRSTAGRSQIQNAKRLGELLIFEDNNISGFADSGKQVGRREKWQFRPNSSLKRAIRMASSKVDTTVSSSTEPSMKQYSFGPQELSAERFGSSVELELKHKVEHEKITEHLRPEGLRMDVLIKAGVAGATKSPSRCSTNFDNLFYLNASRDAVSTPNYSQFYGVVPMIGFDENELSKSTARDYHLPSISVISGVPRGQILTVVRKTVTGLEIERRSSTEVVRIKDRPRTCQLHLCTEHDPPLVKNRTISWVKSQRLLQKRIKL